MHRSDFHFELPDELIAQFPTEQRGTSRLLSLTGNGGELRDLVFQDLLQLLRVGDLLVFNDTRVIPARLLGVKKETGGKVEVLVERVLDSQRVIAHVRASKAPQTGIRLLLEQEIETEVEGRYGELFLLRFHDSRPVTALLDKSGRMPLPPYIERSPQAMDDERYQTVYARRKGAVAAPTAGLHFDQVMLDRINAMGVDMAFITLHVGAGTFQPVRVDDIRQHRMHAEYVDVSMAVCEQIQAVKKSGGRVIAVGTTSVRSLEAAAKTGRLLPFQGETDIFILPGYDFQVVDAMITNFHLPESTLLMLVSAFAGCSNIMTAYRHAVKEQYRFFSYGDAMFITSTSSR